MEVPFRFNQVVDSQWMTGRKKEIRALAEEFVSLNNVIIASPRKSGKTSLVRAASSLAMDWDLDMRVCCVDLFNVRDEELFYVRLAQAILRGVAKDWEEAAEILKKVFPSSEARLSVRSDSVSDVVVDFDWNDVRRLRETFWSMPEIVSRETGLRLVIVIDEMQRVLEFSDFEVFLDAVVRHWGRNSMENRTVAYCLCGSSSQDMPQWVNPCALRDFGTLLHLTSIPRQDFSSFISKTFSSTGKYIDLDLCDYIQSLAGGHPYYVQQIAQMVWLRTGIVCTKEIVEESHLAIVSQLSNLFQHVTESLTGQQICYLKAVVSGENVISTADVLHKYRISSATSASRSKVALIQKDILALSSGKTVFQDPLYEFWLKNDYFMR